MVLMPCGTCCGGVQVAAVAHGWPNLLLPKSDEVGPTLYASDFNFAASLSSYERSLISSIDSGATSSVQMTPILAFNAPPSATTVREQSLMLLEFQYTGEFFDLTVQILNPGVEAGALPVFFTYRKLRSITFNSLSDNATVTFSPGDIIRRNDSIFEETNFYVGSITLSTEYDSGKAPGVRDSFFARGVARFTNGYAYSAILFAFNMEFFNTSNFGPSTFFNYRDVIDGGFPGNSYTASIYSQIAAPRGTTFVPEIEKDGRNYRFYLEFKGSAFDPLSGSPIIHFTGFDSVAMAILGATNGLLLKATERFTNGRTTSNSENTHTYSLQFLGTS